MTRKESVRNHVITPVRSGPPKGRFFYRESEWMVA